MKAIMPKSWDRLPKSEKDKIAEVCEMIERMEGAYHERKID